MRQPINFICRKREYAVFSRKYDDDFPTIAYIHIHTRKSCASGGEQPEEVRAAITRRKNRERKSTTGKNLCN